MLTQKVSIVKSYNKCKIYIIIEIQPNCSQTVDLKILRKNKKLKLIFTILNKKNQKRQFLKTYILYIYVSDN